MPSVDFVVASEVSRSGRVQQLEAMFDVPASQRSELHWKLSVPIEDKPWEVGLIVGPSGAGKSTLARHLFGESVDRALRWPGKSVIDDFSKSKTMDEIAKICQAVGFNTIPAWLRPFKVLSTGERFRVELGRRMLEHPDPIVVDEFSSVVDRQVAKICSHAVQKWVRRNHRQFVAVTCHYDVVDWLQPDWICEPAASTFNWRSVQPRPQLNVEISRVHHSAWRLFAPFHYLTARLHRAARCYMAFVEGQPASFAGVLFRPHPRADDLMGVSRLVTLPDWQGLGIAFRLLDTLGAAYKAIGRRLHMYPAHPALIRSMDRSDAWAMIRRPASFLALGKNSRLRKPLTAAQLYKRIGQWDMHRGQRENVPPMSMRPCATFRYVGPKMDQTEAARFIAQTPRTPAQRESLDQLRVLVHRHPGATRAALARLGRISSTAAGDYLGELIDRHEVSQKGKGRDRAYYPA